MAIVQLPLHKPKNIEYNSANYERFPVRTNRVDADTDLVQEIVDATEGFLQQNDVLCIAESVIAITQKRAYKISDIQSSWWARTLSRYVQRTPAGIGLGMAETMQLAIQEVGLLRILLAASVAAVTKLFGRKGDFYRIAGPRARGIDGPTPGTLPPYNEYASLIPAEPRSTAMELESRLSKQLGFDVEVIIVDANDIGVNILGAKNKNQEMLGQSLCCDNPMGQGHEQTPVMIARLLT